MMSQYDLLIIGAGVIGCHMAYLARQYYPTWRIAIVEQKASVSAGASYYSAGVDVPYAADAWQQQLIVLSKQAHQKLPVLTQYCRPLLAYHVLQKDSVSDYLTHFTPADQPAKRGESEQLPFIDLQLRADERLLWAEHGQICDVNALCQQLYQDLSCDGLTDFYFGEKALEIKTSTEGAEMVTDQSNTYSAQQLVLATGPWLDLPNMIQRYQAEDSEVSFQTKKVAAVLIDQPLSAQPCLLAFPEQDAFLVSDVTRGKWLLSFCAPERSVDPDQSFSLTDEDIAHARKILRQYLPAWQQAVIEPLVFCDSYLHASGQKPAVIQQGPVTVISGLSGSGYRFAAGLADHVIRSFGGA